MISHWLAWISLGSSILLLLKFIARKSKIKKFNRTFSKLHRLFAKIMITTGLIHGVLSLVKSIDDIIALVSGIFLFASAVYVCFTYIHRQHHKKNWMKMHRIGSIVFTILLVVHLVFAIVI